MVRIKPWQLAILILPLAAIVLFLLVAAASQIHDWKLNWIWGVVVVVFAVWRWLLVKWTKPVLAEMQEVMDEINQELEGQKTELNTTVDKKKEITAALQQIILKTK